MTRRTAPTIAASTGKLDKRLKPFDVQWLDRIEKYAMLGLTEEQMAELFNVSHNHWINWKKRHPEIDDTVKRGGVESTANVARSMYRQALGYEREVVKVMMTKDGEVVTVKHKEHVAPNVVAGIFYLKNKAAELWRDRQEHDLTDSAKQLVSQWAAAVRRLDFDRDQGPGEFSADESASSTGEDAPTPRH